MLEYIKFCPVFAEVDYSYFQSIPEGIHHFQNNSTIHTKIFSI